jgi:hypothetical protein
MDVSPQFDEAWISSRRITATTGLRVHFDFDMIESWKNYDAKNAMSRRCLRHTRQRTRLRVACRRSTDSRM